MAVSQPVTRRRDWEPTRAPTARPSARACTARGTVTVSDEVSASAVPSRKRCSASAPAPAAPQMWCRPDAHAQPLRATSPATVKDASAATGTASGHTPAAPDADQASGSRCRPAITSRTPCCRPKPDLVPPGTAQGQPRSHDGGHSHQWGAGNDQPGGQVDAGGGGEMTLLGQARPSCAQGPGKAPVVLMPTMPSAGPLSQACPAFHAQPTDQPFGCAGQP